MSQNNPREIKPANPGLFNQVALQIKLIIRLMGDSRVNPFLKILPVISLLYWLLPDPIPLPFDDAGIMFLGSYLFVELCPRAVVNEHLLELKAGRADPNADPNMDPDTKAKAEQGDVVDGEFHDIR